MTMKYLDNAHTFLPFFYFGQLQSGGKSLVITNHAARKSIDYSTLHQEVTIVDIKYSSVANETNRTGKLAELQHFDARFENVIIDVSGKSPDEFVKIATDLLEPGGSLIILDWSNSTGEAIKNVPMHLKSARDLQHLSGKVLDTLKKNQFQSQWYYLVDPDLKKPKYLVAPGFQTTVPASSDSGVKRWLVQRGAFYCQPHQRVIVAAKPDENGAIQPTLLDRIIAKTLRQPFSPELRKYVRQIYISTTNILIIRLQVENSDFFIRFPFTNEAIERLNAQNGTLNQLSLNGIHAVPKPVEGIDADVPVFVETGVPGGSAEKQFREKNLNIAREIYREAQNGIQNVHQKTGQVAVFDEHTHANQLKPKLDAIVQRIPEYAEHLRKIESVLFAEFSGKKMLIALCHGDFKIGNCLFDKNRKLTGFIDWDMSEAAGMTLVDIASLAGKCLRLRNGFSLPDLVLKSAQLPDDFHVIYSNYFAETGTDEIPVYPAMLYYWVDRVYKQFVFDTHLKALWVNQNVLPVLHKFGAEPVSALKIDHHNS